MIRGLYASAVGMQTNMNRMDVVSNNLANVDTAGFKRETAVQRSFTEELMHAMGGPNHHITGPRRVGPVRLGNFVDEVHIDFRNGPLRTTDNPFDFAIVGEGFFAISMTDRNGETTERFTRNGSFTLDQNRQLRTMEGHVVLGVDGGPITIPADGTLDISALRIVNFENPQSLRPFGDNTLNITPESVQVAFSGTVLVGYLESSNVNPIREMVEMIAIQRNYEANQRVLSIADTTLQRAVNDIARR